MIVVTGASGTNGLPLVKILSSMNVPVRAVVRDPAKATALDLPGVERVAGDLNDVASLRTAFAGATKLFLLAPVAANMVDLEKAAIDVAKAAGVRHVVKLSAIGASSASPMTFARWHAQSEHAVEASGMDWTFLRPNFFMQNVLGLAEMVRGGTVYQPAGDAKASFIDAADTAAVAAAALTQEGHASKTYTLTGPAALGYADVARVLSDVAKKPVAYVDVPRDAAKQQMVGAGMPGWLAENISELMDAMRRGEMAGVTDAVRRVTGRPPRAFEAFAREHAGAFG